METAMTVGWHGMRTALTALLTCALVIVVGAGVAPGAAREREKDAIAGAGRGAPSVVSAGGRAVDPAADRTPPRRGALDVHARPSANGAQDRRAASDPGLGVVPGAAPSGRGGPLPVRARPSSHRAGARSAGRPV